jgi:hypothetical protein
MNHQHVDAVGEELMFGVAQSVLLNGAGMTVLQKYRKDIHPVLSENFGFSCVKSRHRLNKFLKERSVGLRTQTLEAARKLSQDPSVLDGFVARVDEIPRLIVDFELWEEKAASFISGSIEGSPDIGR